jgi:hypothetical protein
MKLPFFVFISQLFFLAGTTLLLIFIVLSGSINHSPINRFYWIQADTSDIPNAPAESRWTYWGLTSVSDGKSVSDNLAPAYPFSPIDNFGTTENVPQDFIDNRDVYYFLSRFAFAFFWIALAFVGISLILSIFSICSYSIVKLNGWMLTGGLLFTAGATSFETAICVMGKNAFHDAGKSAKLGVDLIAMSWTAVTCLIILFFLSWSGLCVASYRQHKARVASYEQAATTGALPTDLEAPRQSQSAQYEDPYAQQQNQQTSQGLHNESGIKFFKIRRHNDQESV